MYLGTETSTEFSRRRKNVVQGRVMMTRGTNLTRWYELKNEYLEIRASLTSSHHHKMKVGSGINGRYAIL